MSATMTPINNNNLSFHQPFTTHSTSLNGGAFTSSHATSNTFSSSPLSFNQAVQSRINRLASQQASVGGTLVFPSTSFHERRLDSAGAIQSLLQQHEGGGYLKPEQQRAFASALNQCLTQPEGCTERAVLAVVAEYQSLREHNQANLQAAKQACETSGHCQAFHDLLNEASVFGEGYQAPTTLLQKSDITIDRSAEAQHHNEQAFQSLLQRAIDAEVVTTRPVLAPGSQHHGYNTVYGDLAFSSSHDSLTVDKVGSMAANGTLAASLFLPGPEDLVIGAFLVSKTGQVVARVVEENGQKLLAVSGQLFEAGSQQATDALKQALRQWERHKVSSDENYELRQVVDEPHIGDGKSGAASSTQGDVSSHGVVGEGIILGSQPTKQEALQRMQEVLRYRQLSWNHEQKKFSIIEAHGVSRAEQILGRRLEPSNIEGIDFLDPKGLGNISLKGPFLDKNLQPLKLEYQQRAAENILKHIEANKAVDIHIIDTKGLNDDVFKILQETLRNSKVKIQYLR